MAGNWKRSGDHNRIGLSSPLYSLDVYNFYSLYWDGVRNSTFVQIVSFLFCFYILKELGMFESQL